MSPTLLSLYMVGVGVGVVADVDVGVDVGVDVSVGVGADPDHDQETYVEENPQKYEVVDEETAKKRQRMQQFRF